MRGARAIGYLCASRSVPQVRECATDLITLETSTHGQARREQRQISKVTLQAAKKYGTKTRTYDKRGEVPRWRFEYQDVVFITQDDEVTEVTSWAKPAPLYEVPVPDAALRQHEQWRDRLRRSPRLATSHSVFVVDHSGSMRSADVWGHRCRLAAVYSELANTFLAKRLRAEGAAAGLSAEPTDVVSLIAMRRDAEVLIDFEPVSWVLHNKLVQLAEQWREQARFEGNYVPALASTSAQLKRGCYQNYALMLLFLSDGGPSDIHGSRRLYSKPQAVAQEELRMEIHQAMTSIASLHKTNLTIGTIGFGIETQRQVGFKVLQEMAEVAKRSGAPQSCFLLAENSSALLSTHLSSLTSSLCATRTLLSDAAGRQRSLRWFTWEADTAARDRAGWNVFQGSDGCRRLEWWVEDKKGPGKYEKGFFPAAFLDSSAVGLAVRQQPFAKGAERVVYNAKEILPSGLLCNEDLVAKESLFAEDVEKVQQFHEIFCMTQRTSANLGRKFSDFLSRVLLGSGSAGDRIPRVEFLKCGVYSPCFVEVGPKSRTFDRKVKKEERAFLVEKKLKGAYTKWNNNGGDVRGMAGASLQTLRGGDNTADSMHLGGNASVRAPMLAIQEGDSEEEDEEEDMGLRGASSLREDGDIVKEVIATFRDDDVPQAFTHWTYRWTKRKKMVCDLQGVLDKGRKPPVFVFTDPCIHYASTRNRRGVFGRTDKGEEGMRAFFKTHRCNGVCRLLHLTEWTPKQVRGGRGSK